MSDLITCVKVTSLPKFDIENAIEMIKQDEFEIGYEIICKQLYEYEVAISPNIYNKIVEIGQELKIPANKWVFLKELIRND